MEKFRIKVKVKNNNFIKYRMFVIQKKILFLFYVDYLIFYKKENANDKLKSLLKQE